MNDYKRKLVGMSLLCCLFPHFLVSAQENVKNNTTTVVTQHKVPSYSLVKQSNDQWYYIVSGKQDVTFTGLVQYTNKGWYYVKSGQIDWSFTGLVQHTNKGWYYVKSGRIDWSFTGLVQHTNKVWYYVKRGKLDWTFTGLVQHTDKRLYYVKKGKIDWQFVGITTYQANDRYYVTKGKVDVSMNTTVLENGVQYTIVNGRVVSLPVKAPVQATFTTQGLQITLHKNNLPLTNMPVQIAVWSDDKGQDDLQWYTAHDTTTIPYTKHRGMGKYHVHVYQQQPQGLKGLQALMVEMPKREYKVSITSINQLTYRIVVDHVPDYFTKVLVPVWNERYGQDDLIWYPAVKKGVGRYELDVPLGNHQLVEGQYHVHVYAINQLTNQQEPLQQTKGFIANNLPLQSGDVKIGDYNTANFSLPIQLTQVAHRSGLKSVKVAVWTNTNGQDDIIWYTANKQSNSEYSVNVPVTNHGISSDTYHLHTYYELNNGSMVFINAQERYITMPLISKLAASIEGLGGYSPSVDMRNRLANEITTIHNQGYKAGFIIYDVKTKKGIAYNHNERFYSASTIKGPYVASLTEQNVNSKSDYYSTIRGVLTYSSNDGYHLLRSVYGSSYLMNWTSQLGLEQSLAQIWYPYISADELAKLWDRSYLFFNSGPNGNQVGQWFENPNLSPIYKALPHRTKSKAGWIGEPGYRAANDAGIVHSPHGDYIIAITSNADGKLSLLEGIVRLLDEVYTDIQTR